MEERTGSFKSVKKKRGKFNAVDLLIILVVLGIISVFLVTVVFTAVGDAETVKLEYTLQFENVDEEFAGKIKVGDKVRDSSSQVLIGVVTALDNSEHYTVYGYDDQTNAVVAKEYPDKYNVMVKVVTNAVFTEGVGYTAEGIRIAVGAGLTLRFPDFVGSAYCVGMKKVG